MAEYKKLFNVAINHSYYTDEVSPDFDIVPLSETAKLMRGNRLLFKKDNTGFRIMYRSEDGNDNPFLPFSDLDLRFAMILKEPNIFENITNLNDTVEEKDYKSGNLVYFRNAVQTDTLLDYNLIDALKPSSFTYEFPQIGGLNGVITIENEEGTDVTPSEPDPNTVKPNSTGKFFYPIDFSLLPPGLYTFTTTVDSGDDEVRNLYIDDQLVRQSIFGLIKIHVVDYDDFPTDPDRLYSASFVRREAVWRYKMVLKTETVSPTDDVEIIDTSSTYTFASQADEMTNGLVTLVFDSNAPIPYSELPITTFDFVKEDPPPPPLEVVIIKALSNPPFNQVSAEGTDFGKSVIYITV